MSARCIKQPVKVQMYNLAEKEFVTHGNLLSPFKRDQTSTTPSKTCRNRSDQYANKLVLLRSNGISERPPYNGLDARHEEGLMSSQRYMFAAES